jgi:GT2 family glycosyltransferase
MACDAVIYDEEIEDPEGSVRPELRAPLDLDTLIDANVWGETLAIRRSALVRLGVEATESPAHTRSQLLLALSADARTAHVPLPLTRSPARLWRSPLARADIHGRAVRDRLGAGVGEAGSVGSVPIRYPVPRDTAAPIAVVIPSKDNLDDLMGFLRSLADLAARPDRLEILVVNNGSAALGAAIVGASGAAGPQVTVLDLPEPFNWSRFNNLAAARTSSPLLLFANDDMLMEARNWDAVLRGFLERADIGAVGARLLYPDRTLQHAGVLFDWQGSTIHDGLHRSQHEPGPALRWHTTRHVSAVTGAFLATRRADFEAVGGFDSAHLAIAYSDVDFCLKLRALGRTILWTPAITAVHFESKSRGLDHLHAARMARDEAERAVIRSRWGEALDFEPSLNPHWFQATLPHRLLSYPSAKRIWSHIEASARPDPWRPRP